MFFSKLFSRAWKLVSDVSTAYGLLPGTFATAVGTAVWGSLAVTAGFIQGVPIFWLMVGVTAVAAYAFTFLNSFNTWRAEQTVEHKLPHNQIRFGIGQNKDESVKSISIGFDVISKAKFPIEFKIINIITSIGDCYPPRKPFSNQQFTVSAGGLGWFQDHQIDIPTSLWGTLAEGEVSYEIAYGTNKQLNFHARRRFRIAIAFDENGKITNQTINELAADDI